MQPKKFIMLPLVLDWLQWAPFEERMGEPNYPQITLTLISELRSEINALQIELDLLKEQRDE